MAIVSSIAVGKARKSAGNVTFTTINGRVIMKEKPLTVRNPQSEKQTAQRSKLARLVQLWQVLGKYGAPAYLVRGKYASAYNQFVSDNMANIDAIFPEGEELKDIFVTGLMIAKGRADAIAFDASSIEGEAELDINFLPLKEQGFKIGDSVTVVIYSNNSGVVATENLVLTANHLETDGFNFVITNNKIKLDDNIAISVFAISADGKLSTTAVMQ